MPVARSSEPDAASLGVIVYGRRTFEIAGGWGGNHPMGVPVIVVTHSVPDGWPHADSTVSFVMDGIESALAQAKAVAGDKVVAIGSPNIAQQCLNLGLLDKIQVKVVSVLLGEGIRFFDNLTTTPIELDGPTVIEGNGVTHLHYRVR